MTARSSLLLRSLREAVVTMVAALATMACTLAIDPEPGPAILAVVLCLSLSRSQLDRSLRGRLEAAVSLPLVSLAALAVAMLLHQARWVGAGAFVLAISLSIWLRRFGPEGRKAGILIALPFVVILVTPYVQPKHLGTALALMMPVIVALLALFWVSVLHGLAQRWQWVPPSSPPSGPATPAITSTMRPMASTRMALQMALALAVSFVIGFVFFAERWAWIVLTAFIVSSGNQGRLDVVHKSLLRVLGAAGGTIAALTLAGSLPTHKAGAVSLMLAAIFVAVWLRPLGYGWWALFITLALALLQGFNGAPTHDLLGLRLEEILLGALIGIAAAWFVLPVRSTDVVRRRIADTLAALGEAFDPALPDRSAASFLAALDSVDKVAPAFRSLRLLTRKLSVVQPADWVDELMACREPAAALIEGGATPGRVRKAIGAARKAMREPGEIQPALRDLRGSLLDTKI